MRTRIERQISHVTNLQAVRKPKQSLGKTRKQQRQEINKPDVNL